MYKQSSKIGNAKLTEELVRNIRYLLDTGQNTPKELSAIYGLGTEQVRRIGRRECWAWVTDSAIPIDSPEMTSAAGDSLKRLLALQGREKDAEQVKILLPETAAEKMARAVREAKEKEQLGDNLLNELNGGKK